MEAYKSINEFSLEAYTFPNIFWESPINHGEKFVEHFKKAWENSDVSECGNGLIHLSIAIIEAVPILGQIAAIIEMLAVQLFGTEITVPKTDPDLLLHIDPLNPIVPIKNIHALKTAILIPPNLIVDSLNLGCDGGVNWNGVTEFDGLFKRAQDTATTIPAPVIKPNFRGDWMKPTEDFKDAQILGRSKYLPQSHLTWKTLKSHEGKEVMANEAQAQIFLNMKKDEWGLRSTFPKPIYFDESNLYYSTPDGYHTYLTDIDDNEQFSQSLEICAHDFGLLLREGLAYSEPISIFHMKNADNYSQGLASRIYTAFPQTCGHKALFEKEEKATWTSLDGGMTNYGSFPGDIEDDICKSEHHLYPDLGQAGLRDLGDFTTIKDFVDQMNEINQQPTLGVKDYAVFSKQIFTEPQAIAHFLSLYQIVFMLIIAKRQQRLQSWDGKEEELKQSFCNGCHALLAAFLQPNEKESESLKKHIEDSVDAERFLNQMRFCFTHENRSQLWKHEVVKESGGYPLQENLYETLPTQDSIKEIWGDNVKWEIRALREGTIRSHYDSNKGFKDGQLGNDSSPNPMVEGMLAILNFTYLGVENYFCNNKE